MLSQIIFEVSFLTSNNNNFIILSFCGYSWQDLINFCKETGLGSSAAAVRTATIKLFGVLHKFVGPGPCSTCCLVDLFSFIAFISLFIFVLTVDYRDLFALYVQTLKAS